MRLFNNNWLNQINAHAFNWHFTIVATFESWCLSFSMLFSFLQQEIVSERKKNTQVNHKTFNFNFLLMKRDH